MNNREILYKEAIREAFEEELAENPRLIVIGEDIRESKSGISLLAECEKKFPGRIMNHLPLVEEMLGGIALGMNLAGFKPAVQMDYSTFITLMMSDIFEIGNWRYRMGEEAGPGITIRLSHEGYGEKGAELGASLLALLLHIPNLAIATPSIPYYAKGLLKTALRAEFPTIFFEHKRLYDIRGRVPEGEYTVPFGTSAIFKPGNDVTIVSWSYLTHQALTAARALQEEGVSAEVISLETLHPLRIEPLVASVRKTGRLLIVEEDMERGGVGGEIAAEVIQRVPSLRIERLAAHNVGLPPTKRELFFLPTVEKIAAAARDLAKSGTRRWFRLRS
ncbi:MAG: hypothetical protein A3G64_00900 [Candidatus Liptonbacteria bacterium RIFCSPLOWO2_12_FULL_60_15]|uniref:Transketolase-like pyrimidine-binding domain-containing protein n=1 Tax=Candidatus Liptonbacteria bacterium RIFCSPLOWO2_12_FULL_60_15 TaxID=1798653 RepID=A0A1G2CPH4_9BACT|nr:MAG: hypothetical protein A3G64_00900 [Candidatus Liptonbacteria bacterium RIFCSPLOWO2_12_FULL_60_15]